MILIVSKNLQTTYPFPKSLFCLQLIKRFVLKAQQPQVRKVEHFDLLFRASHHLVNFLYVNRSAVFVGLIFKIKLDKIEVQHVGKSFQLTVRGGCLPFFVQFWKVCSRFMSKCGKYFRSRKTNSLKKKDVIQVGILIFSLSFNRRVPKAGPSLALKAS